MRNKRNNVHLAASYKQIVLGWSQVACKNCVLLAASCIKTVPEWPPVACKLFFFTVLYSKTGEQLAIC